MPGEAARKQTEQEQQEKRRQDRRQSDQMPEHERRQDERREPNSAPPMKAGENVQSAGGNTQPTSGGRETFWNPDPNDMGQPVRRAENQQSGTSQAQKGEGRSPSQQSSRQSVPAERHEQKHDQNPRNQGGDQRSAQNFGESNDPAFGEGRAGGGGKVDSSQRDMGQTGQTMKTGPGEKQGEKHSQQGPYGPPEKHRGPGRSRQAALRRLGQER